MDEEIGREALIMLSTAIAAMVEDANPADVSQLRGAGWLPRALELETLGGDIEMLTRAIGVIAKRGLGDPKA